MYRMTQYMHQLGVVYVLYFAYAKSTLCLFKQLGNNTCFITLTVLKNQFPKQFWVAQPLRQISGNQSVQHS